MESKFQSNPVPTAPGVVPEKDYGQFKNRHDEDVPPNLNRKKTNVTKKSHKGISKISAEETRFNHDGSNKKTQKVFAISSSKRVRKLRGVKTDEKIRNRKAHKKRKAQNRKSHKKPGTYDYLWENIASFQFFHSRRSRSTKVVLALLLISSFVVFCYHLYNNLSHYVNNPIYMERIYRYVSHSPFPDLQVCSNVQVRWSKLQEIEPFRSLEYVPNLIRLNRQNFFDYIRNCATKYLDLRAKRLSHHISSGTEFVSKCEQRVDFLLSVMEFERKVTMGHLPRLSRNLFKNNGLFNLDLAQSSPVSYEEYERKLNELAANIQTILTSSLHKVVRSKENILQNRSNIVQHFLSESFDYNRFRLAVSGEPNELVAACMIDGKVCNLHITKTNNNGQICFRIDGNSIRRSSGQSSSILSLLLDSHALDVMETIQDVSLKVSFLSKDRQFSSAIEQVTLFPSTYNRVMLRRKRTEGMNNCGSVHLFRHDGYTQAKCHMEHYARDVYHQCGCIPAFSSTRNTESEETSVCRTTKETLCAQQVDRVKAASTRSMCPVGCHNTKYIVMRFATEPLKTIKLNTFPNHVNWTPSELDVFPKHFNNHNPLLLKLHHLLRNTFAELPNRFFPKKHICSDDPVTLAAQINTSMNVWEWVPKIQSKYTTDVIQMMYVVMEKMDRQRIELIMDLFDLAVVKKPIARLSGPSWSTTTVEGVLIPRYVANLMSNYRFLSPCMQHELKQFSQRLRDLQMAWFAKYRRTADSLHQFHPGLQYNLHNLIRLDVNAGDGSEIVERFRAYNVWFLLSEVGGTLALYLGAGLITVFEIFSLLWERYFNS